LFMEGTLLDPVNAEVRVEFGMVEAEIAQHAEWRASAAVFRAIDETLREAAAHPEVFLPSNTLTRTDAVDFAERAAIADLAVRLNLGESTIRSHASIGSTLRERLPQVWAWFRDGEISTQNAREAATIAAKLPADTWQLFDDAIVGPARRLAPARFKARAKVLREKIHTESLEKRHETAMQDRGVWTEIDQDGMGWLNARLSAETIALAKARIDGIAFDLLAATDETRTMQQLRADVVADLLTGELGKDVSVSVALTIPVLSLLGRSTEPAILDGVGPIDIETARILCGAVPSFTRVLTDPVKSTILDVDRAQYRPPAALKRWLALRDVTCIFPGCGRSAAQCDLDHTTAWADGGVTSAENLAHLCRKHHTMKHQTQWKVARPPGLPPTWTSPTGYIRESDPPPF
jgi:Domain of unknown function (DUF222)/HNH endonuclease